MLATAVVMLIWHNVWMAHHGRTLAAELHQAGCAVVEGHRPLVALTVVVGAAVLREGAELVLFLYGIAVSGGGSAQALVAGGFAGLALGAAGLGCGCTGSAERGAAAPRRRMLGSRKESPRPVTRTGV